MSSIGTEEYDVVEMEIERDDENENENENENERLHRIVLRRDRRSRVTIVVKVNGFRARLHGIVAIIHSI